MASDGLYSLLSSAIIRVIRLWQYSNCSSGLPWMSLWLLACTTYQSEGWLHQSCNGADFSSPSSGRLYVARDSWLSPSNTRFIWYWLFNDSTCYSCSSSPCMVGLVLPSLVSEAILLTLSGSISSCSSSFSLFFCHLCLYNGIFHQHCLHFHCWYHRNPLLLSILHPWKMTLCLILNLRLLKPCLWYTPWFPQPYWHHWSLVFCGRCFR